MFRTKLFLACAFAFVVSIVGTSTVAQEPTNQITYFTFSAPFELPGGKTLPAGKYVFKIVDSPSNRHVVQIMSEDQQTMHATLHAIPAQRMEPPSEPEVRFMEAEANTAPAIRTWWYPGRSIGHEFIYPKDHARRLAGRQREGVLTVAGNSSDMTSGDLARINASGQENPWAADTKVAENTTMPDQSGATGQTSATQPAQTAQTTSTSPVNSSMQSTPTESTSPTAATGQTPAQTTGASSGQSTAQSGQTAQTSQAAQQQPMTREQSTAQTGSARTTATDTTASRNAARTELPRTASPLPLIGLLGLGSLLGAGALRFRR
jgi:hypothetical protein